MNISYLILSSIIKFLFKSSIVGKNLKGFSKTLYYEKAQHLTFFFQRTIVYEEVVFENIKKYIRTGSRVFDIGGNVGQYALRFSELVGEDGKVISCEPDFKNYSFLQFNSSINHCKNVLPLNIGVGDKEETKTFYRDTETGGRTGSFNKEFVYNNYKGFNDNVQIVTYQSLVIKYGIPDFVKIDVEGFEAEVVSGIVNFSFPTIFLIEVRSSTSKMIFEIFQNNNFNCICVDHKTPVLITTIHEIPSFANLLFFK